jgi:hypothetical protein
MPTDPVAVTVTVEDASHVPQQGAAIFAFNSDRSAVIGYATTNALGIATLDLYPDDYIFVAMRPSFSYTAWTTTISENVAHTFTGTAIPLPTAGAGLCTVSAGLLITSAPDLNPDTMATIETPYEVGGNYYRGKQIKAVYDTGNQTWGWTVPQGSTVHFEAPDYGINITAEIPATTGILLSSLMEGGGQDG